MNKGMLTIGIILLSIIALLLVNVLTNFSTGSELDYYLVKEVTDAAMDDSRDVVHDNRCGLARIDRERFVESFIWRFVRGIDATRAYDIKFYDISEQPPKVSVKVDSLTVLAFNAGGDNPETVAADITTSYDAIGESNELYNEVIEEALHDSKSDLCTPVLEEEK
ncbi:MAG: hypothetical protein IJI22_04245 [Bacilli bacterium]|nr:hypothetical protein [Bacilli bacterium]